MKRPLLVFALLVAGISGCAQETGQEIPQGTPSLETCTCAGVEPVVDSALLAFLSKAKSAHELADIFVEDDKLEEALAALDQLVEGPLPGGDAPPPEVREVLADTLARTAEIRSELGAFEEAGRDLARGLERARERSLFRGRLMEVRGVVEQRRHDKLLEEGDEAAAKQAKARAIEAFQQAVEIQDDVIRQALGDPAAP
jgi:tetratricopeptide (TPR) repeat protein